jgi:hypothetical protein
LLLADGQLVPVYDRTPTTVTAIGNRAAGAAVATKAAMGPGMARARAEAEVPAAGAGAAQDGASPLNGMAPDTWVTADRQVRSPCPACCLPSFQQTSKSDTDR